MESSSIFRRHLAQHKWKYILGTILLSISCLFQLTIPIFLENFTDGLSHGTITVQQIIILALWIIAVGFGVAFFRSFSRIYIFRLSRILEKRVRKRLFTHWEKLPSEYYNKQRIGDLMAHAINDVNVIREVAMAGVFLTIEVIIMITVTVIAMGVTVNFWLTLLVILPLPGLTYLAYRFRYEIQDRSTKVQEAISQLTSRVQEYCAGIRVVKSYVQEKEEYKKFREDNQHNVHVNKNLINANSMFTSISQGIVGLSYLLSVVFGGIMVMNGTISLGAFVAFNTYLTFLIAPVENLGRVINTLQRGRAADIRLRTILNIEPEVKDEEDVIQEAEIEGQFSMKNLTFHYPGRKQPSLIDINLEVPKGSSLAIVGKVGSGKSTLVNLLLRMYNPPRGTVFIDGKDIFQIPLKTLRSSIGIVPQENFLFSTTIGENIAFDPHHYDQEQIEDAAKLAQVYENIVDFPHSFETQLGERGISLSGGQRQRISMARALIKNCDIIIFDDSLSAVDAETEEKILAGLKKIMHGKTTIIVSHRMSSIQHADQIIVMDQGKIAERGNHTKLLQQRGIYYNMYLQQMMDKEMANTEELPSSHKRDLLDGGSKA